MVLLHPTRGLLVIFALLATSAGFGKEAKIYTVPIRVHLITGAEFSSDGTKIDLWLTPEEFTTEVLPEMNRIWQPAGVQWRVASFTEEPAVKSRTAAAGLDEIKQHAKENGPGLRALLPAPKGNHRAIIDLYLLPSIGAANGIAFPEDKVAVVSIWRKPGKRDYHRAPLVLTEPPYVSVAKTCAHELGHNLGLKHPDPSLKGRLMIAGPGLELTPEEIATARSEAKRLCD
jgi:hypothetical protein